MAAGLRPSVRQPADWGRRVQPPGEIPPAGWERSALVGPTFGVGSSREWSVRVGQADRERLLQIVL